MLMGIFLGCVQENKIQQNSVGDYYEILGPGAILTGSFS